MSTPTPSTRSLRRGSSILAKSYPPTYNNMPAITASDPFGLLPYNRTIRKTKTCILHLEGQDLRPFEWPVEQGARVAPSDLQAYRRSHNFQFPCCLCSLQDPLHSVTESAVFMVTSGSLAGQYVAACAKSQCKYFVLIEHFFPKRGLPVRTYPRRAGSSAPTDIVYTGDELSVGSEFTTPSNTQVPGSSKRRLENSDDSSPLRPFKRRIRNPEGSSSGTSPINPFIVPYATPEPLPVLETPFAMLLQLDASSSPGLTEAQFRSLFVCCSNCKLYTTTSAFEDHNCRSSSPARVEIIDLTADDD